MPSNTYNRAKFLPTMTDPNGQTIHDVMGFQMLGLRNFLLGKYVGRHTVSAYTAGAPDLISYLEYGVEDYWWILSLVNGIIDPINDLKPGLTIIIPKQVDIDAYIQITKKNAQLYTNRTVKLS